ncbi:MAG: HD domain-containing protein [Chloroflexi bacterium]|nr:HD domain-containing protein [Chloroflexota bacterium]
MEVDVNKVYTWANPAGYHFFGADVLGKGADLYFEGEQNTFDVVHSLFNGDENTIYVESWQRRQDGEKRLLAWWCRVMKDGQGNVIGAISSARDITERTRAEQEILQLHDQTEQQVQRLIALRTIDQTINVSFDLGVTLDVVLSQLVTQLGVDAAAVMSLSPHSQTLEHLASRGFRSPHVDKMTFHAGEGLEGKAIVERRTWLTSHLPEERVALARAQALSADKFITYCGTPLIVKGKVRGVLEVFHRAALTPSAEWIEFLELLAGQIAIAMDNAEMFVTQQRAHGELAMAYDATIEGWSRALDLRDKETEGHTQRVTELTLRLAGAMGVPESEWTNIQRGALLHDIGKMGVPDSILLKPGPLTEEEWRVMRQHPVWARDLLSPIAYLRPALEIPYSHHEKWDGTGYPDGLRGERIPLAARIFAVADVWDALLSNRPYCPAWTEERAREHIRAQSGAHFDPRVVDVFWEMLERG